MRVGFVEWPEGLSGNGLRAADMSDRISAAAPDILVTNELPFGPWIADNPGFCGDIAHGSIAAHVDGLDALRALKVPAVISSRPVWHQGRLANEAFVLEDGEVRVLHHKQYFPDEAGFYEKQWYLPDGTGFTPAEVAGLKVGVLLCTEALFNEHARRYGRQGVDLIVIPRATTHSGLDLWRTAAAMASYVSGAYVVSSNRSGASPRGSSFNGNGFAYAPRGRFLTATSADTPIEVVDIDLSLVWEARDDYPCYVSEY